MTWRSALARLLRFWRTSLQFRTVAITVILSSAAVTIIGAYMSVSIGGNLFASRQEQVNSEAVRANLIAQQIFDATDDANPVELATLGVQVQTAVASSTTSPGGTGIAILRSDQPPTPQILQPTSSRDFPDEVVTPQMRVAVSETSERVFLQSVDLPNDAPGLVAGSRLTVPSAGLYELYLVYDLSDAERTLGFVQQTLFAGGLALVALIGGVTYIVVRLVVGPVRLAAETSERLAAGELEVRIPEKGEDVIATLARSFNGMADSLQQQITKLADLSRVQQRFVSDVSHELRTPLTTIRLAGDVLYDQRESFPPATERTAELLHTQVERFEVLLADLLEISRYDAGAVELDLEPTNLVRLVDDAVDQMGSLAHERGSEMVVVAPGGYFEAEVDARRIRRILRNLLGNAVEHGEGRPIVVTVDSNATAVAIAVRDHGIGMSESDVEKVFERFWRADPSRRRTIGGTGLGLAISLEDAIQHDGHLDVWSEVGTGTCFRLTLPRVRGVGIARSPLELPPQELVDAPPGEDGPS
ncbi:MtrAB system histidine kinase MtrB [Marisediminicola sp. LYQ134]|uniref:MtrAB system histidine kinase MtrB n=1 Tax=Marisediminicola sp. LYQ134 TaxID=3391061 RepID=UPI003982E343